MSDTRNNNHDEPNHSTESRASHAHCIANYQAKPFKNKRSILTYFLLLVYLFLFFSTGYFAFIHRPTDVLLQSQQSLLANAQNQETLVLFRSMIKEEVANHQARLATATQAFHIVLGGLLGFLSALGATFIYKIENLPSDVN
ncbi:hypothetical protein [Zooshikella sp. RANM57]|uniref:hypothetical protein n=1 Tax=Zooshikella sp. RANM57 TaxID=3425863 RepID=UPI003D6F37CB